MDEDIHVELAGEYAVARRLNPLADSDRLTDWIVGRLTDEQRLVLAEQALPWAGEDAGAGDRAELARAAVRNFVLAMEGQ